MGSIKNAFDLTGKTALITGGSRGLGLQIAEALGEAGAKIEFTEVLMVAGDGAPKIGAPLVSGAKVTAELTSQNSKLVASLKVLSESYQAGDIADRKEYDRLVGLAYAQNYRAPKAVATKQEPPVDHLILDKFDALTHSITEGLPKEIELRQKQYEYYRDLLLSFPKPEAAGA